MRTRASIFLALLAIGSPSLLMSQEAPIAEPVPPASETGSPTRSPAAAFTPPKKRIDRDGYRKLADPSPFTVRPSTEIIPEETPFPDLSLVGYMVLGGKMNAWVQPADAEDPVQLVEGIRDEASGLLLLGIKGAEDMFTAQAEIQANGKTGTLRFTEAGITVSPGAGAPKAAAANPQGGQPGQPPVPGQPQAQPHHQPKPATPPPTTTPRRRIILPK